MSLGTCPVFGTTTDRTSFYNSANHTSTTSNDPPSPYSYLYSYDRQSYAFDDPEMDKFSYIPAIEFQKKTVTFTRNIDRAIYYDSNFYFSVPEFLNKIQLPNTLDQDLIEKIAIIANYLAKGEKCKYEMGTAQILDNHLNFLVKNGTEFCKVRLPSFTDDDTIVYEEIESQNTLKTSESSLTSTESIDPVSPGKFSLEPIKASRSSSDEMYSSSIDSTDKYF